MILIIIVNYNGWADSIECLESILRSDYGDFSIVVVDNASRDNSRDCFVKWIKGELSSIAQNKDFAPLQVTSVDKSLITSTYYYNGYVDKIDKLSKLNFIFSDKNLGFAGGNNLGIQYAFNNDTDYLWLLNNDTIIFKDTLHKLVKHASSLTNHGIIGSKILQYDDLTNIQSIIGKYNRWSGVGGNAIVKPSNTWLDKIVNFYYVIGASMFVSKQYLTSVGLMDERFFLYYEEIDWIQRGNKFGFKIDICEDSSLCHKEGSSIGTSEKSESRSELSDYYALKNRISITLMHFKYALPTIILCLLLTAFKSLLKHDIKRFKRIIKIVFMEW